jgi:hypothetical protein
MIAEGWLMNPRKLVQVHWFLLLCISLSACDNVSIEAPQTISPTIAPTESDTPVPMVTVAVTNTPPTVELMETTIPLASGECSIGTGLRNDTVDTLVKYKDQLGMVMSASSSLAEQYFPHFSSIRVLGAPSLEILHEKTIKAVENHITYEALGYGLETSESTPDQEWQDPLASILKARELADQAGKLLLMAPGFKLMAENEDLYGEMATLSDIWMLQTQQLQKNPPGPQYRQEVERIINLIRSGNPDIIIWAQITLPPDREPDAQEWSQYHNLIMDLVDGTYIGVYTWDLFDQKILISTIESIFESACNEDQ